MDFKLALLATLTLPTIGVALLAWVSSWFERRPS